MEPRPLSPEQRQTLRRALEDKRTQLLHELAQQEEESLEGQVDSAELEDVAEGVIEDRQRAALGEHDRVLLEEIDHALAKFEAGTYGVSEASGRPIPFDRLKLLPWARYRAGEAEHREQAHSS